MKSFRSFVEGSSAQSRLDRRAAKHGLGSKARQDRIKKSKDFFSKPPPSYSKDDLRRMGHPVERKLTPDELKKREKVAKAIERDNPDMPMDKKMAIATATAKKSTKENYVKDKIKSMTTNRKTYQHALKTLKTLLQRKKKEGGGSLKHDPMYYAQQIARTYDDIDFKILHGMLKKSNRV